MTFSAVLYLFLYTSASIVLSLVTADTIYAGTDIEIIQEKALSFYDVVDANRITNSVVFPELHFKCSGSITSVWFIATVNESSSSDHEDMYPEFQLWQRNTTIRRSLTQYHGVVRDSRLPVASRVHERVSRSDMALYEYRLEDPMHFELGDVLGLHQTQNSSLLVQYLNGGGVRNYIFQNFTANVSTFVYTPNSSPLLEPLLALEVAGGDSCVEGFLSVDALHLYMEECIRHDSSEEDSSPTNRPEAIPDQLSYVFPSLQFSQNGLLEKWLFAAELNVSTLENISIEFEVWRKVGIGMTANTTTITASPVRTGYLNVYEYTVTPPQPVLAGDYAGVRVLLPSLLRPLWVQNSGTLYQRVVKPADGEVTHSFSFSGRAVPLFVAQVKVHPQPQSTAVVISASSTASTMMPKVPLTTMSPTLQTLHTSRTMGPHSTATDALPLTPSLTPSSSVDLPPNPSNPSNSSTPAVVIGIMSVIVLLIGATLALLVFIFFMRRGRNGKEQASQDSEQQNSRDGFFDNPVYDSLQRKLSRKDSHGYSTIHNDPVYLEVPGGKFSSASDLHTNAESDDTGYAELGEANIVVSRSPSVTPVPYFPLSASPSPRTSPSVSPSRHTSPSPVPPPMSHDYHIIELHQQPQDYLEPQPSSGRVSEAPPTSGLGTCSTLSREAGGHDYHELDPAALGGYHRLYMKGIYVPTQEERRESSTDKDNIYARVGERQYATLLEARHERALLFFEESDVYWRPASTTGGLYSQLARNKYREILHSQITVHHPLGSGNFGEVSKGEWHSEEQGTVEVAIKTLKRGSSEEDTVRFLQEAAIMGQFRHPNIVQLFGVVTLAERTMIILEYLSHGDLRTFLVNRRPMPGSVVPKDMPYLLLGFCKDVASGMEYLQRKAFVHRDLAARNILVSQQNSCKIGDFGLSRDLLDESYYVAKGGMIPLKWTAPEALHYRKYSTASDVWSFGCLMYEIWSLGHTPFEGYTNQQVQRMLDRGERLAPPPGCPQGVYSLMVQCWHPDHTARPTFLHLLKTLNSSPSQLLVWSQEDTQGMADTVTVLGAPLHSGETLYPELQDLYTQH